MHENLFLIRHVVNLTSCAYSTATVFIKILLVHNRFTYHKHRFKTYEKQKSYYRIDLILQFPTPLK